MCQESANYVLWAKSGPRPIFTNKVLLEHTHTRLFSHCLLMLSATTAELNSCDRDFTACQAKNTKYLDLYRKSVLARCTLSHWPHGTLCRESGPPGPQLGGSGVRDQTARQHHLPPSHRDKFLAMFLPLGTNAQNKPPILTGVYYDQPSHVIS